MSVRVWFWISALLLSCSAPEFKSQDAATGGAGGGGTGAVGAADSGGSAGDPGNNVCVQSQCADSTCVGVPSISLPWRGPFVQSASACPEAYPVDEAYAGVLQAQETCPTCECTPQAACPSPQLYFYDQPGCTGIKTGPWAVATSCITFGNVPSSFGFVPAPPTGTCDIGTVGAPSLSASAQELRHLCRGAAGKGAGAICAPDLNTPICVVTDVPVPPSCPTGYEARNTLVEGPIETGSRGCSACSCGSLTGTCDGTLVSQMNTACNFSASTASATTNNCADSWPASGTGGAGTNYRYHKVAKDGTPKAQCTPGTSIPEGQYAPKKSWTVCCTHDAPPLP